MTTTTQNPNVLEIKGRDGKTYTAIRGYAPKISAGFLAVPWENKVKTPWETTSEVEYCVWDSPDKIEEAINDYSEEFTKQT